MAQGRDPRLSGKKANREGGNFHGLLKQDLQGRYPGIFSRRGKGPHRALNTRRMEREIFGLCYRVGKRGNWKGKDFELEKVWEESSEKGKRNQLSMGVVLPFRDGSPLWAPGTGGDEGGAGGSSLGVSKDFGGPWRCPIGEPSLFHSLKGALKQRKKRSHKVRWLHYKMSKES